MRFSKKIVVITGASSGIGLATVKKFAAEGATVFASDIDEVRGMSLCEKIEGDIRFKKCDVRDVKQIKSLMDFVASSAGGIDVLFNNAGTPGPAERIDEIEPDQWDDTMNLLLRSVAMGIRYAVPYMKGREGASIINTASIASQRIGLGFGTYAVAKSAVLYLTKVAAADLARYGIRVNSISPGMINTNIYKEALNLSTDKFESLKKKFEEMSVHAQPIAKAGQPDDIAPMVLMLASADASFITGTDMLVDGGITLAERPAWDPNCPGPFDELLANLDD